MHSYTHIHTLSYTHIHTLMQNMHTEIHIHMQQLYIKHGGIQTLWYLSDTHIYTHKHTHAYIHMHSHSYTYTYREQLCIKQEGIQTMPNTHTNTHTHTHTHSCTLHCPQGKGRPYGPLWLHTAVARSVSSARNKLFLAG